MDEDCSTKHVLSAPDSPADLESSEAAQVYGKARSWGISVAVGRSDPSGFKVSPERSAGLDTAMRASGEFWRSPSCKVTFDEFRAKLLCVWVQRGSAKMKRAISSFDNVSSHGDHATYAQYILASDDALRDCVLLIRDRTPLRQWPTRLRLAMNLALRQSCDDTRYAPNRISACRANDLLRFLLRWKVITQDEIESILSDTLLTTSDEGMVMAQYDMDRLLADLLSSVVKWR